MSFRRRLLLFFTIIVVIPMIAVMLVLFEITASSETGKVDARIAQGMHVAFNVWKEARGRAEGELDQVADDPAFRRALASGRPAAIERRARQLVRSDPQIESIALYAPDGRPLAQAGDPRALAPARATPVTERDERVGTLALSVTTPRAYVREVARLTGLEVRVLAAGKPIASTLPEQARPSADSGNVEIGGREYRGRFADVRQMPGAPVRVGIFDREEGLARSIERSRLLIGGILLAFLGLALASSVFVVRMLQEQIGQFLQAARRLGQGDFSQRVPTAGGDEFAALGDEFNNMSEQLAAMIEEVERKRRELEETIRRVGDAFAAGLDRQGIIDLAVQTAVEACDAEAGRAMPIDVRKMDSAHVGGEDPRLLTALEAAERAAFAVRAEDGMELLASLDGSGDGDPLTQRRATDAEVDGVHALAVPLRARLGRGNDVQYVGAVSIARGGASFTDSERDLFAYLAAQAGVSIENADLHETVQLQALTDELTGLSNLRHFHDVLDAEIERSRRFNTDVGLVMLDIDDFKQVNDTYGHQQGDIVLFEVGRVLRELSRDIDEPARYGGEEMAVILPQTDLHGAELLAERMRAAIEALRIKRLDGQGALTVSASFGVSSLPESAESKELLIAVADAALYRAKRTGKNRVERAEPAPAPR